VKYTNTDIVVSVLVFSSADARRLVIGGWAMTDEMKS
jgi:hypothetical protein